MLVGLPGHAPRDTSPVGRLGAGIEAAAMTGPGIFSSLLASLFHEACCVNGLAWFGCACRIDDPHRLDGFATLDRTFEWFDTA
jgi:hypothetical protein